MPKEQCGNCRFFKAYNKHPSYVGQVRPEGIEWGMCRRYAPQNSRTQHIRAEEECFPSMASTQWCGDYICNDLS